MEEIINEIQRRLRRNYDLLESNAYRPSVEAAKTIDLNSRVVFLLIRRMGSPIESAAVAEAIAEAEAAARAEARAEAAPVGPGEDSPAIRSPMPGGTRRRRRRSYRRRR